MPKSDRKKAYAARHRADELFRLGMRDPGGGSKKDTNNRVGWFRSWLFWTGVSFGRYMDFRRVRLALLALHVLLGTAVMYAFLLLGPVRWLAHHAPLRWLGALFHSVARHDAKTYAVLFLVALAFCIVWWRDGRIPLIGLLVGPILLPIFLVTTLAQILLGLPDAMLSLFPKQPPPNFGPLHRTSTLDS